MTDTQTTMTPTDDQGAQARNGTQIIGIGIGIDTDTATEMARLAQTVDYLERCRIARECGVW